MSVPSAHIFCLSHSWFQAQTKEEVALIKKKRKEKKRNVSEGGDREYDLGYNGSEIYI